MILQTGAQSSDIWIYDLIRGALSRVTYDAIAQAPLWSPTGNQLIFMTPTGIRSASVNGIGESEVLLSRPASLDTSYIPTTFSPDSMQLLYSALTFPLLFSEPESSDILSLSTAPEHTSSSAIATDFMVRGAAISPNGLWLAYTSNETGWGRGGRAYRHRHQSGVDRKFCSRTQTTGAS